MNAPTLSGYTPGSSFLQLTQDRALEKPKFRNSEAKGRANQITPAHSWSKWWVEDKVGSRELKRYNFHREKLPMFE
jgi:hypothetical protein